MLIQFGLFLLLFIELGRVLIHISHILSNKIIFVEGWKHSDGKKGQRSLLSIWVSLDVSWSSTLRPLRALYLSAMQA